MRTLVNQLTEIQKKNVLYSKSKHCTKSFQRDDTWKVSEPYMEKNCKKIMQISMQKFAAHAC